MAILMYSPEIPASGCAIERGGSGRAIGRATDGFTLVEMLGVLAVMAILAAVVMPSLIRQIDQQSRSAEEKALLRLRQGLERHILRNGGIPDASTFAQSIATELGVSTDNVLTNDRKFRRFMLIDPAVTNTVSVPFTQGVWGVTNNLPNLLGVVLLSSVSTNLPLTSGFASSSADFSDIWSMPEGGAPPAASWGRGEDVNVERLNLSALFTTLALNYNALTSTNRGRFTVGTSSVVSLPAGASVYQASYLRSTLIGLHSHTGVANTLQATEVLQKPTSFVYEKDTWQGRLCLAPNTRSIAGQDMQAVYALFTNAPPNTNATAGAQTNVINAMTAYMVAYTNWAAGGFVGAAPVALVNARTTLTNVVANCIRTN